MNGAAIIFKTGGSTRVLGECPKTQKFDKVFDAWLSGPEPRGSQVDRTSRRVQHCNATTQPWPRLEEAKINVGILQLGREGKSGQTSADNCDLGFHLKNPVLQSCVRR
jgi:hypothetical protein